MRLFLRVCFLLSGVLAHAAVTSDSPVPSDSAAQSSSELQSANPKLQPLRLALVCGLVGGAVTASQINQASMYWSDPAPFHVNFNDDWQYAHGADKFGHALAANLLHVGMRESLLWSGVDTSTAVWCGFGFALAHQTMIEIRDGFSKGKNGSFAPYLGFSWGDMTANVLGASFPLLQFYIPATKSIRYKYSLNPSAVYKAGGYYDHISDDYESEYHWLSLPVYEWLSPQAQKYWTPLLNIAVGHSVKGLVDAPSHYSYQGHHEWYISLDYNIEALPGDATWWRFIKKALNFYKLPAPCMRISPSMVWYGIRL